jgi:hypothetical protein
LRGLPRGGGRQADCFANEIGLTQPISRVRVQDRGQLQQLIVWLGLQPRLQLIKVLATRQPDKKTLGWIAQQAI